MAIHNWDSAPDALEVEVSELLLATAEQSDELIDENMRQVLHDLRENLAMDVILSPRFATASACSSRGMLLQGADFHWWRWTAGGIVLPVRA